VVVIQDEAKEVITSLWDSDAHGCRRAIGLCFGGHDEAGRLDVELAEGDRGLGVKEGHGQLAMATLVTVNLHRRSEGFRAEHGVAGRD
jgi:hypothetical protein